MSTGAPPRSMVCKRPPRRSRPSSTTQSTPPCASAFATVKPAMPAPITTTRFTGSVNPPGTSGRPSSYLPAAISQSSLARAAGSTSRRAGVAAPAVSALGRPRARRRSRWRSPSPCACRWKCSRDDKRDLAVRLGQLVHLADLDPRTLDRHTGVSHSHLALRYRRSPSSFLKVTRRLSRIRVVQSAGCLPGCALITTSSGPRLPSPAVRVGDAPPGALTRRTTPAAVTEGFVRVAKTEPPSTHQTHIRPPGARLMPTYWIDPGRVSTSRLEVPTGQSTR